MKVIFFTLAAIAVILGFFAGQTSGFAKGYEKGFEAGKAEVQTPAYIVNTCSAWWMGSEREAKKMIDKYCEMKK